MKRSEGERLFELATLDFLETIYKLGAGSSSGSTFAEIKSALVTNNQRKMPREMEDFYKVFLSCALESGIISEKTPGRYLLEPSQYPHVKKRIGKLLLPSITVHGSN